MGRKKLLKKLTDFFALDEGSQNGQKDDLLDLLARLKAKEVELRNKLEKTKDEKKRTQLAQKIEVVHTQRKKGVDMLKSLRHEKFQNE